MSVFTQIQVRRQQHQESKLDPSIDLSNQSDFRVVQLPPERTKA
jgi:hypothetical protein